MTLLPPFTVHSLIKPTKLDAVSKNKGKISFEQSGNSSDIREAITGENGCVMVPVINSSNIMEIGFKENKCRVLFKGLKMFEFEPISEELWLQFLAAKSKGEFFSKHIRNNKKIKVKQVL
jgi:hypothetical protein